MKRFEIKKVLLIEMTLNLLKLLAIISVHFPVLLIKQMSLFLPSISLEHLLSLSKVCSQLSPLLPIDLHFVFK